MSGSGRGVTVSGASALVQGLAITNSVASGVGILVSATGTVRILANTGHVGMLERTAPLFRHILDQWLSARGF